MGYKNLKIPQCRIGELSDPERAFMAYLIMAFCDSYGFYEALRLPKEATETAVMQLIDTGMLRVCMEDDPADGMLWLEAYNPDTESYTRQEEV